MGAIDRIGGQSEKYPTIKGGIVQQAPGSAMVGGDVGVAICDGIVGNGRAVPSTRLGMSIVPKTIPSACQLAKDRR